MTYLKSHFELISISRIFTYIYSICTTYFPFRVSEMYINRKAIVTVFQWEHDKIPSIIDQATMINDPTYIN